MSGFALVRAGHLHTNPLEGLRGFKRNGDENVDPFTGAELRAILEAVAPPADFATMLRLWAKTGMRAGEVAGLQCQDLDLEAGAALLRRTWSRQHLGPTKTGIIRSVSFLHPTTEATGECRPGLTQESRGLLAGGALPVPGATAPHLRQHDAVSERPLDAV